MGIPVHALTSADDVICIGSTNLDRMGIIPTLSFEEIADGWDHIGMLNNDPLYMSTLTANMPLESIPVSDPLICPVVIEPVVPESTCELQVVLVEEEEPRKSRNRNKRRKRSGSSSSRRRELSSSSSSGN